MSGQLFPLLAPLPDAVLGAFTTRAGGVSSGPYAEFNLAGHVGDEPSVVTANRHLVERWLGARPLHVTQQVHGAGVATVTSRRAGRLRISRGGAAGADALVTALPGVPLAVLVADCLPVLLAEPVAGVVAATHAGRRGLVAGVLHATICAMTELGADPARTVAVLGPSIGGCCYEVPSELQQEVAATVPGCLAQTRWGSPSLDLPSGAAALLLADGIGRVERVGGCTYEDARFYSYRRASVTGRFAGVVVRRA